MPGTQLRSVVCKVDALLAVFCNHFLDQLSSFNPKQLPVNMHTYMTGWLPRAGSGIVPSHLRLMNDDSLCFALEVADLTFRNAPFFPPSNQGRAGFFSG